MRTKAKSLNVVMMMAAVFAMLLVMLPSTGAEAATRLKVSEDRVFLNGAGTITVTLENHQDGETVKVTPADKTLQKIKVGKWKGDTCTIKITPKKSVNTSITIECAGEKHTVELYMHVLGEMTAEEVYEYAYDATVEIQTVDSAGEVYLGTGFFIGDGLVLTDYHIVSSASKITIQGYDGKTYDILSVAGYSEAKNLIVFNVSKTNTAALSFANSVKGGEKLYSFGSPVGVTSSFTDGIVANPLVSIQGVRYVQLSMPAGVGSGGGPVLNSRGQVMGIMTLTVSSGQCLNFAIKYGVIERFLDTLTPETELSLAKLYEMNAGKTKESNDYGIIDKKKTDNESNSASFKNVFPELTGEEIYELAYNAMVDIVIVCGEGDEENTGTGSGFFVSADTIITNNHVVTASNVKEIRITDYNGHKYVISDRIRTNSRYDLAILTVTCEDGLEHHTNLELMSGYTPAAGEQIYTLGSPLGYSATISTGVVALPTAYLTERAAMNLGVSSKLELIAITAPITGGNSGGPLLNKYGKVIGVNAITINITQQLNLSIKIEQLTKIE